MKQATVVDLAAYRLMREHERRRRAELILWSPPLFWWGWATAVWELVLDSL